MSEYTLGVEEEYQILDPETRELLARGGRAVQRRAQRSTMGDEVVPELLTAQIEAVSPICRTLGEVRAEVVRLRREVNEAATREGAWIAAASTHPFSDWRAQRITPKERYKGLVESYRRLALQQAAFGFHVHVGLADREAAIRVMNRLRPWLAPMLALSANSPFWLGEDTGYASYRTQVWGRMPVSGPPGVFGSKADYDGLVGALVASGVVADATKVYWDTRLPEDLDTIEVRVMDVCSRVDEAVMMAGLTRALVHSSYERAEHGEPYPEPRLELLRAAHWLASRHGLDAHLLDPEAGGTAPAREVIEKLLAFARPALEDEGDWEEVSTLVHETLEYGNGANRQRHAYEKAGRLEDVVGMLVEETTEGTAMPT